MRNYAKNKISKLHKDNPVSEEDILNNSKISLAESLSQDKKPLDSSIVGIMKCRRLDQTKLTSFINANDTNGWSKMLIKTKLSEGVSGKTTSQLKIMTNNSNQISSENRISCFDNYIIDTPEREILYHLVRRFAYAVINHCDNLPLGLILGGKPGVGKTHLEVAVLNFVFQNSDKKILYIDEKYVRDYFQCHARSLNIDEIRKQNENLINDNTLPQIINNPNFQCINKDCTADIKNSKITYIKFDFENMDYLSICNTCGQKWTNKNI